MEYKSRNLQNELMAKPVRKIQNVAAVMKVFTVLEALADERRASLADIAQRAMTSKTTAHRLLQTMIDLGYVQQDQDTEKYGLTLKLFGLGAGILRGQEDLLRAADQTMLQLSQATGEAINLGVLDDFDQRVAYIHKYDSTYSLSTQSTLGKRNPIYSTALGKALLAFRHDAEIHRRLAQMEMHKLAQRTITDPKELYSQLQKIHAQGYAEENEESEAGVRCIAVPVLNYTGHAVAAISIGFPLIRFDEARKSEYINMLLKAGHETSVALGYRQPFS